MENVLDHTAADRDPKHPVICYDEKQFQKLSNVTADIPMKPGSPRKQDSEYKREGTCCILIAFEPKTGKRMIQVKDRRTKKYYAYFMKDLVQGYPEAEYVNWFRTTSIPIQQHHFTKHSRRKKPLIL